jgi:hypothetical protein
MRWLFHSCSTLLYRVFGRGCHDVQMSESHHYDPDEGEYIYYEIRCDACGVVMASGVSHPGQPWR